MKFSSGIVNLTPHEVVVITDKLKKKVDGTPVFEEYHFKPSGIVARISTIEIEDDSIYKCPCVKQKIGEVINLPDPSPDTYFLVSIIVFNACPERTDLISPDTGNGAIRNEKGQIIATKRFIRR